jgi:hypothetical protein
LPLAAMWSGVSRRIGHASVAITLRVYSHEFESYRPEDDERDLAAFEAFAHSNWKPEC